MEIICELNNKQRPHSYGDVWEKKENKLCKQETCPKLTGRETQSEFHLLSTCTCYLFTFQLHQSRPIVNFFKFQIKTRRESGIVSQRKRIDHNSSHLLSCYYVPSTVLSVA